MTARVVRVTMCGVAVVVFAGGVTAAQDSVRARRDPFAPIVAAAPAPATPTPVPVTRASGLAGVSIAEVTLTGVLIVGNARIALFETSGGKTYPARINDRLHDGVVRRIERGEVVLGVDAAGGTAAHEVYKPLRFKAGGGGR